MTLRETAATFLAKHCPPAVPRAYLDGAEDRLPPFWDEIARLGWLGIQLPQAHGGGGGTLADAAVVLEEMGRAVAPGPYLPTVLAGTVIDRLGTDDQRAALLPGLAAGTTVGAVAFAGPAGTLVDGSAAAADPPGAAGAGAVGPGAADPTGAAGAGAVGPGAAGPVGAPADGAGTLAAGRLEGTWPLVLGAGLASVVLVPVGSGWCVVDAADLQITPRPSVDETRRVADVSATNVPVAADRVLRGDLDVERLAVRLLAAEAVGAAGWCVDTAAAYAKVREQFGRPVGQFQAVKHRCADMHCGVELARAAAWDAARDDDPLADVAAAALAPEALLRAAEGCIQVLGGIGFTWEHDAHLYLKRALAVRALVGPPGRWRTGALALARSGRRRRLAVDLPPEAESHRAEVRAFLADLKAADKSEWRRLMADAGYAAPHWPRPWGRSATALEQLVVDDEFAAAGVKRPHLQVGAWALPTVIAHGDEDQQARWIPPTLRGELTWCQLFSEPGAGSDLASLSTKAVRVDGGWQLTGQKVWTTLAAQSDLGLCLARSDADAPRHDGITCFVVDMRATGVEIRPLRELTGFALFNEVFLTDVFVPDDDVVGPVGGGWRAARTTLGNERVSMGSGSSFGLGEEALLALLGDAAADTDPVAEDEVGRLLIEAQALSVLALRMTLRALDGAGSPGPEASVRKLLGVEHDQKVQEAGWALLGRTGATTDGPAGSWVGGYLANRCLTIAGGTSEIQRNVIAERLLGLPKDPGR